MKKILAILTVLAIMLSISVIGVSTTAYAREASPESDFIAFEGVIEEYIGPGGDVVIPESIDGEPICEIAQAAFFQNQDITSVDIPEGVTIIGNKAFSECSNLVKVTLPYSLTDLGGGAFSKCALTEVTIPGNVQMVKFGAFSDNSLSEINFSYGVKEIHSSAFNSNYICDVVFPESVELICGFSFVFPKDTKGSWTFTICNPYCEVGYEQQGIDKCVKHEWNKIVCSIAYSSINSSQSIKYIVPKDSELKAFIEEKFNYHLQLTKGTDCDVSGNTIIVNEREADYFANLEQNQKDYGITEETYTPSGNGGSNSSNNEDEGENSNDTTTGTSGNKTPNKNNSNKNDKNSNSTTTVVEGGNDSTTWIILAVVGGVFLLLIIGVVVFAIIFLKKPQKAAAPQTIYMMGPDGKLVPVVNEQPVVAETPLEETPTEE